MATYMLLIRGGQARPDATPEELQRMMQQYLDWSAALRREGRLVGAEQLADGGRTLRVRDGKTVVEGPYPETKEAIGGYYLVSAENEADAIEMAKGCPTLGHGGLVDLRPVVEA
jgi:hypothetical protein